MKKKQIPKQNKPSNKQLSSATKLPTISQPQHNSKKQSPTYLQANLSLNTSSYQDEGLITLMQQYLIKNNLFDTLQVFQRDCLKGFKVNMKSLQVLKKQLIQAFDKGESDTFFNKFTQYVPLSMRTKDAKTLKMQFYAQLYFYIYPIHPILGKKKTVDILSKQNFTTYLQGRGSVLAKQSQFLPFYALAYLPKPQQHQSFNSMFTKQWIDSLKKQLTLFVDKLYPTNKTPTIVTMYDKFIEYNLQTQKFSSMALTEPDQEYNDQQIQEVIEQNLQDSIINNHHPVLLQNHHRNQNNLLEKGSLNKIQSPYLITDKERDQIFQLNQRINSLQQEKVSLLSFIQNSKNKYQNLQNDFKEFTGSIQNTLMESQLKWFRITQELYNVAKDLFNAAQNLNEGIPLSTPDLLNKIGQKLARYQSFINMNVEDLLSDNVADYSIFQRPEHDLSMDLVKKNAEFYERDQKFMQIDFQKIRTILGHQITEETPSQIQQIQFEKNLILQALRWRITRTRGAFLKRQVILSYTVNDVLGLKDSQKQNNIVTILLNSKNTTTLFYTMLLISALSKDYYGREYLFNEKLIKMMMDTRRRPETDEKIKGIVLVIFQLQSNKRSSQSIMIDNGMIEEMVEKLDKERDSMSTFIMEYASALLLNLILSKKGLDRAEAIRSQILMTLINLMQTQSTSVKSFVHASLYPLLSRKVFREKALEFGMQENIKYLLENSPSVAFEHQLKYVYERLMLTEDIQEDKQEEPEFDEINDQQIGEDDYENGIEQINNALSGEFFLMKKYPLTGPDAIRQMNNIKQEVKVTFSRSIYYERQKSERLSVQTPLLGKGRKNNRDGFANNNSVYSNKSSNRILISEKNSRIKNSNTYNNLSKERLDTVHQNGSETSLKENRMDGFEDSEVNQMIHTSGFGKVSLGKNNSFEKSQNRQNRGKFNNQYPEEQTFRQKNQSFLENSLNNKNQDIKNKQNNNQEEKEIKNKKLKPYEENDQYKFAFQTRAALVRTPPQKEKD